MLGGWRVVGGTWWVVTCKQSVVRADVLPDLTLRTLLWTALLWRWRWYECACARVHTGAGGREGARTYRLMSAYGRPTAQKFFAEVPCVGGGSAHESRLEL